MQVACGAGLWASTTIQQYAAFRRLANRLHRVVGYRMIREARLEDAAAIAEIHVRGWQAAYAGILPAEYLDALSVEKRTPRWQGILGQPRSGTLVCVEGETVTGWIDHGSSRDADCAGETEIYAIYVTPGRWGRGVGTQLLQRAEQDVFGRGIVRISLWVLEQNVLARRFYERGGFADDGTRKNVDIGGASLVEMRYEKRAQGEIRIVDYVDRYRTAFKTLNEAWITRYFRIEEGDRRALDHPDTYILDRGGHILVALDGEEPIGVCALVKMDDGQTYELAKMAVAPHAQGRGIGHHLGTAAIAWARTHNARRLYLESNTILEPAIRLYRKLGFTEITGQPSPYARSNIQMELRLD